jgi:disulfide bond formation protein DsbB
MQEGHTTPSKISGKLTFINYLIFLQALVATFGSLYYSTYGDPVVNLMAGRLFPSEGGFVPCELCWFSRILMYPMMITSAVALIKEDRKFTDYILPVSIPGILLSFYHYGLQKFDFPNPFRCTAANPCSALQVNYLGFITIPFLALIAYVVITALAIWYIKTRREIEKIEHTRNED